MDLRTAWNNLCDQQDTPKRSLDHSFVRFLECFAATPEITAALPAGMSLCSHESRRILRAMTKNSYVEAGSVPQTPLALTVALFFAARGLRTFVLSAHPLPLSPSYDAVLSLIERELEVSTRILNPSRRRAKEAGSKAKYSADIVFADYTEWAREAAINPGIIRAKPSAAVICEADLCLYDKRLMFFDKKRFFGTGALYHVGKDTTMTTDLQTDVVDVFTLLKDFTAVTTMTSFTAPRIRQEILGSVGTLPMRRKAVKQPTIPIPAVAYRTQSEKIAALVKDISSAGGKTLIYYVEQQTGKALRDAFGEVNMSVAALKGTDDLLAFLAAAPRADNATDIGLYAGLPAHEVGETMAGRPRVNVFIAEHFPFEHHHQKIFAFVEKYTERVYGPYFFLSLEDTVAQAIAPKSNAFAKAFHLIDTAEDSLSKGRLLRVRAARAISRKIYKLRRTIHADEIPIITTLHPSPDVRGRANAPSKEKFKKQLQGDCFCGSGKPFSACHGRKQKAGDKNR